MRFVFGLIAFLIITPSANAETQSVTLGGHQFHFNIPPGYVERVQSDDNRKVFHSPAVITFIQFLVQPKAFEEEFSRLKGEAGWETDRLFGGRVGRQVNRSHGQSSFFGSVFAASCSGQCIIKISVAGTASNGPNLPFDFAQAQSLLESYANQLGSGDFGGD